MGSVAVRAPHAIVFIVDPTWTEFNIPEREDHTLVAANATCVSVGTAPEFDGDVELRLEKNTQLRTTLPCLYDGVLETPGRTLGLITSGFEVILKVDVHDTETRIKVHDDDSAAPTGNEVFVNQL